MGDEYRKELVSPDGKKVVSTSERETNDLVYGRGYREADTETRVTPADVKPSNPEPKSTVTPPKETP